MPRLWAGLALLVFALRCGIASGQQPASGSPDLQQQAPQDRKVASDESARVLSLESIWNQAEAQHDTQAMNMLLADTFVYTDDDGSFMDKAQWPAHVTKGVDQYEQLGNSGMRVDQYGYAAVVTGKYREKIKEKGKTIVHSGRFTDTWIQKNGQWKCVASQATLISP